MPNMADRNRYMRKEKYRRLSFTSLMMLVIFRDVADRVQADGAADNADDQRHDDGELVHEQAVLDLHRMPEVNSKPIMITQLDRPRESREGIFLT